MKRRPLRVAGGFGLYALCICLSTIALQALTTPSPTSSSFLNSLNSVDSFLWRTSEPPSVSTVDLKVRNLSVHRVRYVEEQEEDGNQQEQGSDTILTNVFTRFFTASTTPRSLEVSSVVVTWEDHPLAAHARVNDARLDEGEDEDSVDASGDSNLESYSYEVQIWVTGWGLDALWNPANKRVITKDPFLILTDLPLEQEMAVRVRMKAKQIKRSLLGFVLPLGFFSTETDGPWSETVILLPTRDDELEAIVTSLASNKPLLLLLALCIGSGCVVVAQLYLRRKLALRQQRKLLKMQSSRRSSSEKDDEKETDVSDTDSDNEDNGKSVQELKHEIRDLRQELADSEDEVRQLMLLSGYGIDALAPHELEQLERELKHTLKRIHDLKKHPKTPERLEAKDPVDEQSRRERRRLKQREALPMSPIYEHRSF
ncbi:hypothetical protein DVH05_027296 [Phytophthora capsici]|nr:hypothetical protein DVH05_027296 [Phytophthora capsici]